MGGPIKWRHRNQVVHLFLRQVRFCCFPVTGLVGFGLVLDRIFDAEFVQFYAGFPTYSQSFL